MASFSDPAQWKRDGVAARDRARPRSFWDQNFLADPTLELHNANGALLASNDDWQADAQAAQIPADSRSRQLHCHRARENNTTGVALVEVYYLSAQ